MYEMLYRLAPRGLFGLPDRDTIVVPAGTEVDTPAIDRVTGLLIGTGTVPKYRDVPLSLEMALPGCQAKVWDNNLEIAVMHDEDPALVDRVTELVDKYCMFLSVWSGFRVSARIVRATIKTENGVRPLSVQQKLRLGSIVWYDLQQLRQSAERAGGLCCVMDQTVIRACEYYCHGLFLQTEAHRIMDEERSLASLYVHLGELYAEAVLAYSKAVFSVIGDPSKDRDYQSRYRKYGISRVLWSEAQQLWRIRSDRGAAHHLDNPIAIQESGQNAARAGQTAKAILEAYGGYLARQHRGSAGELAETDSHEPQQLAEACLTPPGPASKGA